MPMNLGLGLGLTNRAASGSAPPPALILDTLSAGAAYSTRKLRTAYSGAAIRVRRSSDNTEQDIGFNGTALDTAALSSFVGANSGFVTTWYDQSGNARHVTQTTQANQPRIVNAGTIETLNGLPAVWCDGSNDRMSRAATLGMWPVNTTFFVMNLTGALDNSRIMAEDDSTAGAASFYYGLGSASNRRLRFQARNDADAPSINGADISPPFGTGASEVLVGRMSGSSARGFLNGTAGTAANYTPSGTYTFNSFHFPGGSDKFGTQAAPVGHYAEAIVFIAELSNADMNTVALDQGSAYGITVNPF